MKFRTNLNMVAVLAEGTVELNKMRAASVPMVHIENERVIQEIFKNGSIEKMDITEKNY